MIRENVIPIEKFGVAGIPDEYNSLEFASCTNGIINAIQSSSGGLASTYMVYDNVESTIVKSNNISAFTLNSNKGFYTVSFIEPITGDYLPLVNAHREGKGEFPNWRTDLLFCGYRNKRDTGMDLVFSFVQPNRARRGHNDHRTGATYHHYWLNEPQTLSGEVGKDGGFDYFTLIII